MKKILLGVGVLATVLILLWLLLPFVTTLSHDEPVPESSVPSASVPIVATPAHPASGSVMLVTASDGSQNIRFEDFKTLNGPDLFVYLARDTEASEFVSLGRLRATEGSVNYPIPEGVDVAEYPFVLTWCRAFSTLFNYADLSPVLGEIAGPELCIQVITPARNPHSGEVREFPTPCDVPEGWVPLNEGIELNVI